MGKDKYIIIFESSLSSFQEAVCAAMRNGYTCQGGIAVYSFLDDGTSYYQAMVSNDD